MSHFAQIDENNIVTQVLVIEQDVVDTGLFGNPSSWIQTSYNGNIRKNYAGIGYTYDTDRDAFIPPKNNCHAEEILDEATCRWTCSNAEHTEIIND